MFLSSIANHNFYVIENNFYSCNKLYDTKLAYIRQSFIAILNTLLLIIAFCAFKKEFIKHIFLIIEHLFNIAIFVKTLDYFSLVAN